MNIIYRKYRTDAFEKHPPGNPPSRAKINDARNDGYTSVTMARRYGLNFAADVHVDNRRRHVRRRASSAERRTSAKRHEAARSGTKRPAVTAHSPATAIYITGSCPSSDTTWSVATAVGTDSFLAVSNRISSHVRVRFALFGR